MTDTPAERGAESTWTRLRRRKVVQWGLVYVAAAWGFVQGLEYLSGTYDWPRQLQQLTTLALLIGLPVVLVLAWYHGDRGQQRISTPEFAILTLLLLLGGGGFWYYQRANQTPTAASTTVQPAARAAPLEAAAAPDQKSIAVLPFADMSAEKNQEYMSDGIAEELLNLLAKAPDLKVIARTSSFAFKGEKIEIAEIAKKLNVAHVLEGSVRKSGNKVRITAQLIRTADSTHLWSETYDRPLDDIFAVQDEIADAIAQALQIKLMGGELTRREGGTQNLRAYEMYLKALSGVNESSKASVDAAGRYLEEALKLDPNFGSAWSLLGNTMTMKGEFGTLDTVDAFERARQLHHHALEVSPDLSAANSSLAGISLIFDWDWDATEAAVKRAFQLDPAGLDGRNLAGRLYTVLGRADDAVQQFQLGLARDPLDPYLKLNLGHVFYLAARLPESETTYRQLLAQEPAFIWTRIYLGKTLLARGDTKAALAMVRSESDEAIRLLYLPIMLDAAGLDDEADVALKAQIAEWADTGAYYVAQTYAYRGDSDLALEWLERAYKQRDPGLIEMTGEPLLDGISNDPRFDTFLRKMNIPDVW